MKLLYLVTRDAGLEQHWRSAAGAAFEIRTADSDWPADSHALVLLDLAHPGLLNRSETWWQQRSLDGLLIATNTLPDDAEGMRLLGSGVRGYCHAAAPAALLQQVLNVVSAGEIWAGRTLVQHLLATVRQIPVPAGANPAGALAKLSEREQDVARLAAQGAANKEIARQLGITERTVKAHLSAAFEKLGVADRVQLTLKINGLMP